MDGYSRGLSFGLKLGLELVLPCAPLQKRLVGAKDSVPEREEGGVIANIVRVMEVVVGGRRTEWHQSEGRPGPVVATVCVMALTHSVHCPHQRGHEMNAGVEQQDPHLVGQSVAKYEL